MIRGGGVALATMSALLPAPVTARAAFPDCVPPVNIPDAPGGPVVTFAVALAVIVSAAVLYRRRGGPPVTLTTLTVALTVGVLVAITAAAPGDPCGSGGGSVGGVAAGGGALGTTTSIPFTGAAIPWIAGSVLLVLGLLLVVRTATIRRRARGRARD